MAYITKDQIRNELQSGAVETSAFDAIYEDIADAVSEAIDEYCFRTFTVPSSATARTFKPTRDLLEVDELDDIANATSLAVAIDTQESGSYTVTTDWVYDTNRDGMVTAIRSTGTFPWSRIRPKTVQVTARWGWPATPAPVERAALIWAIRLVNRRSTPTGVVGFGEFGGVRLTTIDPDVKSLLAPYRRRELLLR